MPQVIIKRKGSGARKIADDIKNNILSDEIIVEGDQVIVNSDASVTVTFAESEIVVSLGE